MDNKTLMIRFRNELKVAVYSFVSTESLYSQASNLLRIITIYYEYLYLSDTQNMRHPLSYHLKLQKKKNCF